MTGLLNMKPAPNIPQTPPLLLRHFAPMRIDCSHRSRHFSCCTCPAERIARFKNVLNSSFTSLHFTGSFNEKAGTISPTEQTLQFLMTVLVDGVVGAAFDDRERTSA
jgi:hypothetical protein